MIFSHERRQRPVDSSEGETRIPLTLPTECLGVQCPRFTGATCESREDLIMTDGRPPRFASEDAEPLRRSANYAIYGRVCAAEAPAFVALRAEMLDASVTAAEVVGYAGAINGGTLPLDIHRPGQEPGRVTIFETDQY